ncbi:hypothetical protein [Cognaticolwellia beringensis]|uniref:hypothetical protein n=1 Tax=Cognaticolwellia beringensis TaxID=1967665 RepID=UPI0012FA58C6|nr:hypothetical protein [Cognaticolwellia beringensis]|tara:strand:+ start:465 stop:623 length:159 start_codon:yes stop_codon:yes gene_type:complete
MEWLNTLLRPETLALLIPIVAIVGAFSVAALKAHHRHQERIEKIKNGFNPDS